MIDEKEVPKCHFYLTDKRCKKGKSCSYWHGQHDEKRRHYTCGAVDHMSSSCPRQ